MFMKVLSFRIVEGKIDGATLLNFLAPLTAIFIPRVMFLLRKIVRSITLAVVTMDKMSMVSCALP
jgi:hypothetical protein